MAQYTGPPSAVIICINVTPVPSPRRSKGLGKVEPILVDDPHAHEENEVRDLPVFRNLRQDVEGFNARVRTLASSLSTSEAFVDALAVGGSRTGRPSSNSSRMALGP